jgi:ferredoxin
MVMIYFSGTGNSKHIAELFSKKMNIGCYSIEDQTDFSKLIEENETIAFCYPIYASRVPRILREFVAKYKSLLKNKKLIIFCTQVGFSGDGARVFTDMFERGSMDVVYAEHFNMPNNINNIFIFPLGSKDSNAKCVAKAENTLDKVCKNIKTGKVVRRGFNFISIALGLIQGVFAEKMEESGKASARIDIDCNKCGICVRICPMKNLKFDKNNVVAEGNCTLCYRCINKCPQKAISIYTRKKVTKQYNFFEG